MSEGYGTPSRRDMERAAIEIMVDNGLDEDTADSNASNMSDADLEGYLLDVRESGDGEHEED